ncbi:MAG: alpha/beta hydrolase [Spirochaetes bacterium]|nr:alpha/beta hydrolase [Spirochaetota bacterium]MBU1080821.1 alpha/beta hydrolase [Spirochaetota bacterium]
MKRDTRLAALGAAVILVAGIVASVVQTDGGDVRVSDLRFAGSGGAIMSALLYAPKSATAKTPAPAILAVHGYINSRETQSGFAIEFARRGYVVLCLDQTGHGYSDSPAFANGFGGPDGLAYLRSLDIVDKDNIGLEGHSMGGWTVLAAAAAMPDAYKSMVLEGSSTGAPFAMEGSPAWPRNLGVVFSTMDEFSPLMWGVARGKDAPDSPKLKAVFGADSTIEAGRVYGSKSAGTARALFQPKTTHPGDHLSAEAIGYAISWFDSTLEGARPLAASSQTWFWKELATLAAFAGFVVFVLGAGGALLGIPAFAPLAKPLPTPAASKGAALWAGGAIAAAVPVLTFFPFFKLATKVVKASAFWPQNITNQIMVWALLNGAISLALFLAWHFASNRKKGGSAEAYGLAIGLRDGLKTAALAACSVGAGALLLLASDFLFKIDFRFWVVALKPMSLVQFKAFLAYLVPFTAFFLMSSVATNGQLRPAGAKAAGRYLFAICSGAGGFLVFLLAQYAPLLAGGTLLSPAEPLNVIIAVQFLPLLSITSLFSVWFFEKTGRAWAGAFVNGLFVTWYIVAGQAFHFMVQ